MVRRRPRRYAKPPQHNAGETGAGNLATNLRVSPDSGSTKGVFHDSLRMAPRARGNLAGGVLPIAHELTCSRSAAFDEEDHVDDLGACVSHSGLQSGREVERVNAI